MKHKRGFTMIEMLVVISISAVVGVIILTIFSNTLKGTNKSQIISVIKENGQAVLENMDKTIRNSDSVFCSNNNAGTTYWPTLVLKSGTLYTRYKFFYQRSATDPNGYVLQETLNIDNPTANGLTTSFCVDYVGSPATSVKLTDDNSSTGISIFSGSFTLDAPSGFAPKVTVIFQIKPGVGIPASIAGQVDPVTFQTTVELRNTNNPN